MNCHDKIIDNIFFKNDKYFLNNVIKFNKWKNKKYININQYIKSRYSDSLSDRETIYRIHYNIDIKPKCPICNKPLKFYGKENFLFSTHCSNKCKKQDQSVNKKWKMSCGELGTNRQKAKETMKKRYGVENPYQIPEIINKIKKINKEKQQESLIKQKQTCLQKYGVEYVSQSQIIKDKIKQTSLERYGVPYPIQSQEVKDKYNWKTIVKKIISTKEQNKSFNTSKIEDESYILIKEKYNDDVIRQYKEYRYPFLCDFYIPSLDLFIECQYGWQHGNHPFNKDNNEDIKYYNKIKSKNTKYYNNVLYNWTIRDVKKRNTAKENNLNYIEFWNIEELKDWLKI